MPPPKSNSYKGIVRNGRANAKAELQVPGRQADMSGRGNISLDCPGHRQQAERELSNRLAAINRTQRA